MRSQEVLTAAGMGLTIFCGQQSYVGIRIAGSFVGTLSFYGSRDGVNFFPVSVTPFASGTAVPSVTTTGNWFVQVSNLVAFRVLVTAYTSGSPQVYLSSSLDNSYQDAFLATTAKFVNTAASGATNTTTIAAQTNRAWRLRRLVVTVDTTPTWASSPNFKVTDGASTILWAGDLPAAAGVYDIPLPAPATVPDPINSGLVNTPGASLVVTVASGGGSVKTNVNCEIAPA